jgi:hypothetical protein
MSADGHEENYSENNSDRCCVACGWSARVKVACRSRNEAMLCPLQWENRRKFFLRFRGEVCPPLVRSVRYQGREGKGDSYERLEPAEWPLKAC